MQLKPMVYILNVIEIPKDYIYKTKNVLSLQSLHISEIENSVFIAI